MPLWLTLTKPNIERLVESGSYTVSVWMRLLLHRLSC